MKLYHFNSSKFGLDDITKCRIRISRINELNDPFEFLANSGEDPELRKAFKNTKNGMDKNRGIICFSETWSNPVMLSHYADRHTGMCLGFEVVAKIVERVQYSAQRLTFSKHDFTTQDAKAEQAMRHCIYTKFSHWEYEEEWRAFVSLDHSTKNSQGHYFLDFNSALKLTDVMVGAESKTTRDEVEAAVSTGGYDYIITRFKTRPAFRTFHVVRNKNNGLWK